LNHEYESTVSILRTSMNKKTIALSAVAVIGVAYVAATAYVGSQTEKVVREQVAKANSQLYEHLHAEHSTDYARLNILSFDRDVFKSEAIYQLELRIANERFDLQFEDTCYHGPLRSEERTSELQSRENLV